MDPCDADDRLAATEEALRPLAHHNKTPIECYSKQRPQWKHVVGMVFGMQCWGYKDKADRPQLGIKGRHDRWGFYVGRNVDTW
jgi:hypothetical protein